MTGRLFVLIQVTCETLNFLQRGSEVGSAVKMESYLCLKTINMAHDTWLSGWSFEPLRLNTPPRDDLHIFFSSTARKADPRARGRATFATGEREASPGSDRGVRAGTGADGLTAAAILQVRKGPGGRERVRLHWLYWRTAVTLRSCLSTLIRLTPEPNR